MVFKNKETKQVNKVDVTNPSETIVFPVRVKKLIKYSPLKERFKNKPPPCGGSSGLIGPGLNSPLQALSIEPKYSFQKQGRQNKSCNKPF